MFKNSKFLIIFLIILVVGIIFSSYFIWQNNSKINQNSQIKPLIADSEHDVVVLEECDLAVKYEKSLNLKPRYYNSEISKYNVVFVDKNFKGAGLNIAAAVRIDCGTTNLGNLENKKVIDLKNFNLFDKNFRENISKVEESNRTDGDEFIGFFKSKTYIIETKNKKHYEITFFNYKIEKIDKFQLQFNSLAPSTPSVKL